MVAGFKAYDEKTDKYGLYPWEDCEDFVAQQLGECFSSHYSAYLFKKNFIASIPHRPDFEFRDDRLFILEVAMAKPRVEVFKQFPFTHRHHIHPRLQQTLGLGSVVTHWQQLKLYQRCLTQLQAQNELTPRRAKAAAKVLWPLAHWIAYTHPVEAAEVATFVYRLDPSFISTRNGISRSSLSKTRL
ncbi:MAG: hypothetical protein HC810_07115 [Acaryochloridaceae cyanobacterium RL_2_7]|nr:hypothetical protein [Acaryochloridaceae cyanobacterium RL_2_7]